MDVAAGVSTGEGQPSDAGADPHLARGAPVTLWPTVIYQRHHEDVAALNNALRRQILDREPTDKSRSLGVVGARKSSPDLLRWATPETDSLLRWIGAAVDALTTRVTDAAAPDPSSTLRAHAWAVVYRSGGFHTIHAHHDAAWSGVYYVHTDNVEDPGGELELFDPRSIMLARHAEQEPTPLTVDPAPGLLVAFPSWLLHRVTPVHRAGLRICVAFNVSFE